MKKASLKYKQLMKKGFLNNSQQKFINVDPYSAEELADQSHLPSRFILTDKFSKTHHAKQNTVTPVNMMYKSKGQGMEIYPPSPSKSIYELVTQKVDVPEGLLFRGKYVAKTRNSTFPYKSAT